MKTYFGRIGIIIFMAAVIAVSAARPSAAVEDDSAPYELGEVVVSEEGGGVEEVGTVMTVDAAEIRQRGARTLDEALALIPGLTIRTGGDGTPRIDIRGFRTRHVLLLLDGTPFNSTFDGQFDPTVIPVENIAEIRVTTGGASVLYGQGGNGGVINIITKKGVAGAHGYIAGEGAEGEAALGKASLSGGTDRLDFFASGSVFDDRNGFRMSDDFEPAAAEDGELRGNSRRRRYNAFANMGWSPSERTLIGLTFNYLRGEFGKPPVTNFSAADPFTSKAKFDRADDMEGYTAQVAASHDFEGPFSVRGWAYYNRLDMLENRYDDANYSTQALNGSFRDDSKTEISGVNVLTSYDAGMYGRATLALMFENDDWVATGFQQVRVGRDTVRQRFSDDRDFQVYSAAVEYEAEPVDGLGVVAGYGHHFQERQDAGSDDDFSYLFGAHYDLPTNTTLRASHGRKVRFPTLKQLYEQDGGNPDLVAERSLHYEAGVEQELPAATLLSLTGFVTDVKNFIEKDTDGVSTNFQKYRFEGVEIAVENRLVEGLFVRAAWSYLHTRDNSPGGNRDELQYRPRNKVSIDGVYRFPFGLTAYASFLYVGEQYFYDKAGVEKKELNDYALVDAKLSQDVMDGRVNLYIGARNLLDKDYEQSYGLPQAGRTVYGGVEVRI